MRDYVDLERVEQLVRSKHISRRKHPKADLYIYNYTPKTMYNGPWTNETMRCRGLILDGEGNVRGLSFRKFFGLGESVPGLGRIGLSAPVVEVTEKIDGRLLLSYRLGDELHLASRGAFLSDEALFGTHLLQTRYDLRDLHPSLTLVFELVDPDFRVVIDYPYSDLVLIGARDTESGADLTQPELAKIALQYGFPVVPRHDLAEPAELVRLGRGLPGYREGFVLRLADGERLKVKGEIYRALAQLVSDLTPRRVLESLIAGDYETLIASLPEPYLSETLALGSRFQGAAAARLARAREVLATAPEFAGDARAHRKAVYLNARERLDEPDALLLMNIFDGTDPLPAIYRAMLPEALATKARKEVTDDDWPRR